MTSWEDRVHRAPAAAHAFWGGASARSLIAPGGPSPPSARPQSAAAPAVRLQCHNSCRGRPSTSGRSTTASRSGATSARPFLSHRHGAVERGFDAFAADAAASAGERRALMQKKAASPQGRRPTTTMVGMYDEEYPPEYPPPPRSPPRLAPSPSPTRAVSPGRAPVVGRRAAPRDNNVGEILLHDHEEGRPPSPERPTSPSMTFAAGMTAEVEGGEPLKESLLMGPDYTMPYTPCST